MRQVPATTDDKLLLEDAGALLQELLFNVSSFISFRRAMNSYREFAVHCARCDRPIAATDWVRRAKKLTYHLACFACDICKRQLSTGARRASSMTIVLKTSGEHFALQYDTKILCKQHYLELVEGESGERNKIQEIRMESNCSNE